VALDVKIREHSEKTTHSLRSVQAWCLSLEICSMAKLVYGLMQSLDGYVDHMKLGPPAPAVGRYFTEQVRGLTGLIYGRRTYEIMRYWEEDLPDWDAEDRDFAVVWRSQPKWVMSHSLKSVGPNATLIAGDFEKMIRRLKAELAGEIHVGGPVLAQSLSEASLIDEYRLYLRPVVLGGGQPFFAGPRPPLHLVASDLIADDVIRLSYVPA
jgi:dihydrofolate reductase